MSSCKKVWIREIIWLTALIIIAALTDFLIFKQFSLFTDTIDIQIHDTYYVFGGIEWVFDIFIILATFTYLIKEAKIGYNQILPNVILSVLLILLLFFIKDWHLQLHFLQTLNQGWTGYPPLNALPATVEASNNSLIFWNLVFLGTELLLVIGLFLLGFKTGRLKERS
jgi:hypothetical protein